MRLQPCCAYLRLRKGPNSAKPPCLAGVLVELKRRATTLARGTARRPTREIIVVVVM